MTGTRIDGHVHFHSFFSLPAFLGAAKRNFERGVKDRRRSTGVLMLAGMDAEPSFSRIERQLDSVVSNWDYSRPDKGSFLFQDDEANIVLISGQQLITAEQLELLVFCTDEPFPNHVPIRLALEQATQRAAVAVIPWGFGKWWFRRGRILSEILDARVPQRFLIGDSGCRPAFLSSAHMSRAKKLGIQNLAGSDPLPLRSHEARVGSFGTVVPGQVDLSAPTNWVRERLFNLEESKTFGKTRMPMNFVADQVRIRIAQRQ